MDARELKSNLINGLVVVKDAFYSIPFDLSPQGASNIRSECNPAERSHGCAPIMTNKTTMETEA